ncbi:MAG TPA: hypothetical protein VN814_18325 [Caulobacteraceae bacterium]|nr:hypothetical protein [Caulobacteraceae bacterium]
MVQRSWRTVLAASELAGAATGTTAVNALIVSLLLLAAVLVATHASILPV